MGGVVEGVVNEVAHLGERVGVELVSRWVGGRAGGFEEKPGG